MNGGSLSSPQASSHPAGGVSGRVAAVCPYIQVPAEGRQEPGYPLPPDPPPKPTPLSHVRSLSGRWTLFSSLCCIRRGWFVFIAVGALTPVLSFSSSPPCWCSPRCSPFRRGGDYCFCNVSWCWWCCCVCRYDVITMMFVSVPLFGGRYCLMWWAWPRRG